MGIGATMRENGVLKLVHPGRHVEVHTKPIFAAEVLKKNPRHCIARPDVFKFPWIVIQPESVLQLGRVFYIVPNHTIYRLSRSLSPHHQKHHASRLYDHHQHLKKQVQVNSSAEVNPKYQQPEQHLKPKSSGGYKLDLHKQQFPSKTLSKDSKNRDCDCRIKQRPMTEAKVTTPKVHEQGRCYKREVADKSYSKATRRHQDYNRNSKQFKSWAKVTPVLQGAMPRSRIEMTPKHRVHSHCLKPQSLIKHAKEATTRDQYHGQLDQQSATYPWHTEKEDSIKTLTEHSAVSNNTSTRDQYRGQLGQQPATYSFLQVAKKEAHRKTLEEHSAVSDKTTTRGQYRGRLEQQSATYSWHEVTKKEDHSKRFEEHSAVEPCVQKRPSHGRTQDIDDSSYSSVKSPIKKDNGVPHLKSCLRKKDSDGRSLGLRVTFSLPSENAEKPECSRNRFCF